MSTESWWSFRMKQRGTFPLVIKSSHERTGRRERSLFDKLIPNKLSRILSFSSDVDSDSGGEMVRIRAEWEGRASSVLSNQVSVSRIMIASPPLLNNPPNPSRKHILWSKSSVLQLLFLFLPSFSSSTLIRDVMDRGSLPGSAENPSPWSFQDTATLLGRPQTRHSECSIWANDENGQRIFGGWWNPAAARPCGFCQEPWQLGEKFFPSPLHIMQCRPDVGRNKGSFSDWIHGSKWPTYTFHYFTLLSPFSVLLSLWSSFQMMKNKYILTWLPHQIYWSK